MQVNLPFGFSILLTSGDDEKAFHIGRLLPEGFMYKGILEVSFSIFTYTSTAATLSLFFDLQPGTCWLTTPAK